MQVLANLAPLYLVAIISYILRKKEILAAETSKVIVPVLFKVSAPALVFMAISQQELSASSLFLILLGVFSFAMYLIVFSFVSKKISSEQKTQKAVLLGGVSFAVGTIAYPLIQLSFPQAVFAQVVIMDLTLLTLFMALMPMLVSKDSGVKKVVDTLTKDPIILSVYVGILFSVFGLSFPDWLNKVFQFAGGGFSFLSAVLLGVSITIPTLTQLRKVFSAVFAKMLIWIGLSFLVWYLPIDLVTKQALIMTISAPVGLFPVIYAKQYNQDEEFVVQMSIVSVFLSLLLYPLLISLIS